MNPKRRLLGWLALAAALFACAAPVQAQPKPSPKPKSLKEYSPVQKAASFDFSKVIDSLMSGAQ